MLPRINRISQIKLKASLLLGILTCLISCSTKTPKTEKSDFKKIVVYSKEDTLTYLHSVENLDSLKNVIERFTYYENGTVFRLEKYDYDTAGRNVFYSSTKFAPDRAPYIDAVSQKRYNSYGLETERINIFGLDTVRTLMNYNEKGLKQNWQVSVKSQKNTWWQGNYEFYHDHRDSLIITRKLDLDNILEQIDSIVHTKNSSFTYSKLPDHSFLLKKKVYYWNGKIVREYSYTISGFDGSSRLDKEIRYVYQQKRLVRKEVHQFFPFADCGTGLPTGPKTYFYFYK